MNFNYISLDLIIERLNTIKLPDQELNISELKEWTWEALSKIGTLENFIDASIEVEILDGKGEIPKNIYSIHSILEGESGYNMDMVNKSEPFKDLSYKLNAGFIFTSFEEGSVIFQCSIFPVDEDNKPLIPDNEYFISAVYSYIRMKLGERAFWRNKIVGQQFQWLEKEWLFYCPAAKNQTKMMNEDRLHNFKSKFLKPLPNLYRNNNVKKFSVNVETKQR